MSEQIHAQPSSLIVGRWKVDLSTGEASAGQESARLEPRMLDVLVALASRSGEVVSKDELRDLVWAGVHVSDDAVWRCLAKIRKSLSDRHDTLALIETLPRRGYRLNADVTWEFPLESEASFSGASLRRRSVAVGLALGVTAVVLWVGHSVRAPAPLPSSQQVPIGDPRSWTVDELFTAGMDSYARLDREDVIRAVGFFERALDADPGHGPSLAGLSMALRFRTVYFNDGVEHLQRARVLAERAVDIAPDLPEAHKAMGLMHGAAGEVDEEIASYERAIELRPDYATALGNLAIAYMHRGRLRDALDVVLEVTPAKVEQPVHLANTCRLFALLGGVEHARDFCAAALAADPVMVAPTVYLVRLELASSRPEAAQRWVDASAADPESVPMLNARADLALARGDLVAARDLLSASVAAGPVPRNYDARTRLIFTLSRLGEKPADVMEYTAWLRRIAEGKGGSWLHAESLAGLLVTVGEPGEALAVLERAAAYGHLNEGWLRVDPLFESLHGVRRFENLLDAVAAKSKADLDALRRDHGALTDHASAAVAELPS